MKFVPTLIAAAVLFSATSANAALQSRLGGLAVYDTDLDITWLANATSAVTYWSAANAFVANLTVEGISGWRLPSTPSSDASCNDIASQGRGCAHSEMGHLFNYEMGGPVSTASTSFGNFFITSITRQNLVIGLARCMRRISIGTTTFTTAAKGLHPEVTQWVSGLCMMAM